MVFHEAHVEAVEVGRHYITIENQPGCEIHGVEVAGKYVGHGPQTVAVDIKRQMRTDTIWVDVAPG
jgi:hypothetical protein